MPMTPRPAYIAAVLLALAFAAFPAAAAVEFEFSLQQNLPFKVGASWGVAVDELGDIYVADTGAHRIVKFDSAGNPIKAWGSEGSLPGQLYYPLGVATSSLPTPGNIRVYVADDGNHRIVTYNGEGKFLSAFGSEGSGNNQLRHPRGIAILPYLTGGTEEICAADTGNARISCFNEQGQWRKSFDCADCPDGRFVAPQGIFVRRMDSGGVRYYVSDNYPGRVVVLSESGRHLKTIGGPGHAPELQFPDDLVADKDGSVYVTESGFGLEHIAKFDADGEWQFVIDKSSTQHLTQPHAIAIDSDGDLVVGHFAEPPVHKFRIVPPRIKAEPDAGVQTWIADRQAYMSVVYNGVEQTCRARIVLSITAEGQSWTIRTATSDVLVTSTRKTVPLILSVTQANRLKAAAQAGLRIKLVTEATARCESDGTQFVSKTRSTLH